MSNASVLKAWVLLEVGGREIQIQARESFMENVGQQQGLGEGRESENVECGSWVRVGMNMKCLGPENEAWQAVWLGLSSWGGQVRWVDLLEGLQLWQE